MRTALRTGAHPRWLSAQSAIAAAIFDVDDFGSLVDTYGLDAGDRALAEVSHRLRDAADDELVWLLRTGDDEFCIVLPATRPPTSLRDHVAGIVAGVFD